jgi:hypothetical protein
LLINLIALGASIHEVLNIAKGDKTKYPSIDLHYSQSEPLTSPVVVTLTGNGLRMRFDGPDQRLRLIEVLDFRKINLAHKGSELVQAQNNCSMPAGPNFKRVYKLLGPSYPGEYHPPPEGGSKGVYVLSWSGVALNFPLLHSAYSPDKDHVSLLGSNAASPATTMALFAGESWPETRKDLFNGAPAGSRATTIGGRAKDSLPPEIEFAMIRADGKIELYRDPPNSNFTIVLNQTTPQDLVTELGPPDATHKREEPVTPEQRNRANSSSRPLSNGRGTAGSQPSSYSSTGTDTFDTDFDNRSMEEDPADRAQRDKFWCYFNHGMDILVGLPTDAPTPSATGAQPTPLSQSPHPVVLKVIIHGNVPGSYAFNRHRRLRWELVHPSEAIYMNSECHFDEMIKPRLLKAYAGGRQDSEMARGKVVNRTWGGTAPSDSSFMILGGDEDLEEDGATGAGEGSEQWLGNTKLYAFPGLAFEVLQNACVSALTVC